MTPLQIANAECANFNQGNCAGIMIADNLKMTLQKQHRKCVLSNNERCKYFEECVLPFALMASDPSRSKAFIAAADTYRNTYQVFGFVRHQQHIRQCPDCGGRLGLRKRVCPTCAQKRRKITFRQAAARMRSGCQQLS